VEYILLAKCEEVLILVLSVERIYYPVKVLGPGERVGIWVCGCHRKCKGCISPEMQTYNPDKEIEIQDIIRLISCITYRVDGITISGGEPFFNPKALCKLVEGLSEITDDILIFTGYSFDELIGYKNEYIERVLSLCSAIVDGPYEEELHSEKGLKGSSNQKCIILNHHEKYKDIEISRRELQLIVTDKRMITIGIP